MSEWTASVRALRATGVGSLPGASAREAMSVVTGEFPELVHLPELPARGPGGDLVGRTAALLAGVASEFSVETTPTGWRYADRPGPAVRRALSYWREDLDVFEESCQGATGDLKLQLCGPVTLAASISLRRGERVLSDQGAMRDLVEAHREAVVAHITDLRRRLPAARWILQIDEPAMDAALRGALPTQSGWGRLTPLEEPLVRAWHRRLAEVVRAGAATPWLHACTGRPPIALALDAGYSGLSGAIDLLRPADDDALGAAVEGGMTLIAGVVPATAEGIAHAPSAPALVDPIRRLYGRIGLDDAVLAASVVISPACGLGDLSWASARAAMALTREAAHVLADQLDAGPE